MNNNYLRRLRRKAKRFGMSIYQNRGEEGGYLLVRLADDFNIFGGPVDLDDIAERLRKED